MRRTLAAPSHASRVTRVAAGLMAAALVVLVVGMAPPAQASKKLPVPYTFIPAVALGAAPGADAPGTNDWNCRPSTKHPRPVILVHGTAGNRATNWQTYGPLLKNEGYCVFALTYGAVTDVPVVSMLAGMGDMRRSAQELKTFVDRVLAATGARKVDLIGHSQGTLMPSWYVKFLGGAAYVKNYISLAPLWHGTQWMNLPTVPLFRLLSTDGDFPYCVACGQFAPDSAFMKKIRQGGVAVKGITYTNIMTRYDELVLPYSSGKESGMRNIVVQDRCPWDFSDHLAVAASRNASIHVLNALDPAHPKRLTCTFTLPVTGHL